MKKIVFPTAIYFFLLGISHLLIVNGIYNYDSTAPKIISFIINLCFWLGFAWWIKIAFYNNIISFKEIFTNSLYVAAVSSIIVGIFDFIMYHYFYPSFLQVLKEKQIALLGEKMGTITASQEALMNFLINPLVTSISAAISIIFMGAFCSLFAGLIFRTRNKSQVNATIST